MRKQTAQRRARYARGVKVPQRALLIGLRCEVAQAIHDAAYACLCAHAGTVRRCTG